MINTGIHPGKPTRLTNGDVLEGWSDHPGWQAGSRSAGHRQAFLSEAGRVSA